MTLCYKASNNQNPPGISQLHVGKQAHAYNVRIHTARCTYKERGYRLLQILLHLGVTDTSVGVVLLQQGQHDNELFLTSSRVFQRPTRKIGRLDIYEAMAVHNKFAHLSAPRHVS